MSSQRACFIHFACMLSSFFSFTQHYVHADPDPRLCDCRRGCCCLLPRVKPDHLRCQCRELQVEIRMFIDHNIHAVHIGLEFTKRAQPICSITPLPHFLRNDNAPHRNSLSSFKTGCQLASKKVAKIFSEQTRTDRESSSLSQPATASMCCSNVCMLCAKSKLIIILNAPVPTSVPQRNVLEAKQKTRQSTNTFSAHLESSGFLYITPGCGYRTVLHVDCSYFLENVKEHVLDVC